jgi:hypothetical protein
MGQLCAFWGRNRGCSHDDIAVADRRTPFEGHVLAAALGCYLTPICGVPGDLRPDLPLEHNIGIIIKSDGGFCGIEPFSPAPINLFLRGIPVCERTPPWNPVFDSYLPRMFVAQLIASCGNNSAIESVPVYTRDARHGILAMPESARQSPGSSYAYTQPKSVVNRKVERGHGWAYFVFTTQRPRARVRLRSPFAFGPDDHPYVLCFTDHLQDEIIA